ncbi:MAG: hypothetical protein AAFN17_18420 [Pseudomonadota bacterium]
MNGYTPEGPYDDQLIYWRLLGSWIILSLLVAGIGLGWGIAACGNHWPYYEVVSSRCAELVPSEAWLGHNDFAAIYIVYDEFQTLLAALFGFPSVAIAFLAGKST